MEGLLTTEQRDYIVEHVNKAVDIPRVPEPFEGIIFRIAVDRLDKFLHNALGGELYSIFIGLTQNATTNEERDLYIDRLATMANGKVNLPIFNEEQEQMIFRAIIEFIVTRLQEMKE